MSDPKQPPVTQHEPRVPGGQLDEPETRDDHPKVDHPNKPFRPPSKNKTHPAPEVGTDGDASKRPEPPARRVIPLAPRIASLASGTSASPGRSLQSPPAERAMASHTPESRDCIAPKVRPPVHIRGGRPSPREDHPNKPFPTPAKNKPHPAPETGADGDASKRPDPAPRE